MTSDTFYLPVTMGHEESVRSTRSWWRMEELFLAGQRCIKNSGYHFLHHIRAADVLRGPAFRRPSTFSRSGREGRCKAAFPRRHGRLPPHSDRTFRGWIGSTNVKQHQAGDRRTLTVRHSQDGDPPTVAVLPCPSLPQAFFPIIGGVPPLCWPLIYKQLFQIVAKLPPLHWQPDFGGAARDRGRSCRPYKPPLVTDLPDETPCP